MDAKKSFFPRKEMKICHLCNLVCMSVSLAALGWWKLLELPQCENCCCCFIDFLRKLLLSCKKKKKKICGPAFLIRREQKMGIIRNQGFFQQCSVHLKLGVPGSRTRPWCPLWLPCFWMKICLTAPIWSLVPSSSNTGR